MPRVFDSGRARRVRTALVLLVLVTMVLSGLIGGMAYGLPPALRGWQGAHSATSGLSPGSSSGAPAASSAVHSPTKALPTHPFGSSPSAIVPFWGNNSTFALNRTVSNATTGPGCQHYTFSFGYYNYSDNYCYGGFTDPTALRLGNGHLGVGYDVTTSVTPPGCPQQINNQSNIVSFATSADGGVTFNAPVNISLGVTCSDFNAIEPTFAESPSGILYAAWVAENYTGNPQMFFDDRTISTIEMSTSLTNGASWSVPSTVTSIGNLARPQLATFGNTVYLLFENITNTTTTSISYGTGSCCASPISLNVMYTTTGGVLWNGPYLVPGVNATLGYDEFGGWIQANAAGSLGITYFSNQSCVDTYFGFCYDYGVDLLFAASNTNGSSWSTPFVIQSAVGETEEANGVTYLSGMYNMAPHSQFVFSPDGSMVYATWDGNYNKSSPYGYYNYQNDGVFAAAGNVSGAGWSTIRIAGWLDTNNYDHAFNPSIGWVGTSLHVTFTWGNETYCSGASCPQTDSTFTQYQSVSTDGVDWTSPVVVDVVQKPPTCTGTYCFNDYYGYLSSVTSLNASYPVLAYILGAQYHYENQIVYTGLGYNYYYNETYQDRLEVSFPYTGPTVTVTFSEQYLPVGTNWSFTLNGYTISTTSASINVTDIPYNTTVTVFANNVPSGYNQVISPGTDVPPEQSFTQNTTLLFNYSVKYGLQLAILPVTIPFSEIEAYIGSSSTGDFYEVDCGIPCYTPYIFTTPPFPWYFPVGTVITLINVGNYGVYPAYWNGTGSGSYNGTGIQSNITMNGPVNETAWYGSLGSYAVQVNPVGLPSTSTYSFVFDGTTYSAAGTTSVSIPSVITGAHTIDGISATSSTAGWGYVGYSTPSSPFVVPVNPVVNLSFAYIDIAAAAGTVTFHAAGITSGTVWHFAFNGTTYSSDTPWINVTTRPGTFPVQAFSITSQNSSVGLAPTGVGKTMAVSTGSTYTISYSLTYEVKVTSALGGSVSGAGSGAVWVAAGGSASFTATAHPNYAFGGWSGTGPGSYTGTNATATVTANGPIVESAAFYPLPGNRFNLTFRETGLAPGTWWTVMLGGNGYSSNQTSFNVTNLLSCSSPGSNYALVIPYAYSTSELTRYVPTAHLAPTICTTGSTVVVETFAAQYFLSLQQTTGGFAQASIGTATFTGGVWVASGATVILNAVAQNGYNFLGWNGTGIGSFTGPGPNTQQTIVPGGPVTELASFALPVAPPKARFWIDFHLLPTFAAGTSWSVTLNGTGYSATGSDLIISNLLPGGPWTLSVGTSVAPDGLTQYAPVGVQPTVTLTANKTVDLSFSTSYWVSVSGTSGGAVRPASGWFVASASVLLSALPSAGFDFIGWAGTGSGSYTGSSQNQSVRVTAPMSEVATFQPHQVPVTSTQTSTGSSIFASPLAWAGFAAVGLLVGLVLGLLFARRRSPPAAPQPAEEPPAQDASMPTEGTQ